MKTTNSTLELFTLKSYVSVLTETEKEAALKIVGGGDPPGPCDPYEGQDLNIHDCSSWSCFDSILENDLFFIGLDDDGNLIWYGLGAEIPDDENTYMNGTDWEEWKEENPCLVINYQ